jgi:hypothetical protein
LFVRGAIKCVTYNGIISCLLCRRFLCDRECTLLLVSTSVIPFETRTQNSVQQHTIPSTPWVHNYADQHAIRLAP